MDMTLGLIFAGLVGYGGWRLFASIMSSPPYTANQAEVDNLVILVCRLLECPGWVVRQSTWRQHIIGWVHADMGIEIVRMAPKRAGLLLNGHPMDLSVFSQRVLFRRAFLRQNVLSEGTNLVAMREFSERALAFLNHQPATK